MTAGGAPPGLPVTQPQGGLSPIPPMRFSTHMASRMLPLKFLNKATGTLVVVAVCLEIRLPWLPSICAGTEHDATLKISFASITVRGTHKYWCLKTPHSGGKPRECRLHRSLSSLLLRDPRPEHWLRSLSQVGRTTCYCHYLKNKDRILTCTLFVKKKKSAFSPNIFWTSFCVYGFSHSFQWKLIF